MSGEQRGQLVLVATPIGNLGDLSPRAREVLASADLICCEDTRRTRVLLSASGISAKGPHGDRLLSLHGHNEASRLERVAAAVAGGATVATLMDHRLAMTALVLGLAAEQAVMIDDPARTR